MKQLMQWAAVMALGFVLVGCNTMRGFGQDVQKGGEKVEGAATDVIPRTPPPTSPAVSIHGRRRLPHTPDRSTATPGVATTLPRRLPHRAAQA